MKRALIPLSAVALAAGLFVGTPGTSQAATVTAAVPAVQLAEPGLNLTPVQYYGCYRRCVAWRYGYCYKWRRYCPRQRRYYY